MRKKNNVLQFFPLIFYETNVKTFLKLIINQCLKAPVNMILNSITFHVCVCTPKIVIMYTGASTLWGFDLEDIYYTLI